MAARWIAFLACGFALVALGNGSAFAQDEPAGPATASGVDSEVEAAAPDVAGPSDTPEPTPTPTPEPAEPADPSPAGAGDVATDDADETDDAARHHGVEEILVTAQRREQSLQDVPAAVSAFSGSDLDETGVYQMQDIAFQVPNLHYGQEEGSARITIRGVSTAVGTDQATAFHIDGVYQNDPAVGAALTFFDTQRVEILRGPQGTLYGRNATGGAINVISNPPSFEFDLNGDLQIGTYHQILVRGAVNVPLVEDMLALRVSTLYEGRDGYQKNQFIPGPRDDADDADDLGVRAQLLYRPIEDLDVTLRFNYFDKGGVGYALKQLGPIPESIPLFEGFPPAPVYQGASPNPADVRRVNLDTTGRLDLESIGGNAEIRYFLGDLPGLGDGELKLMGSYVDRSSLRITDQDATDIDVVSSTIFQTSNEWVTEINLTSTGAGGSKGDWDWVFGLFGFGTVGDQAVEAPANLRLFPPLDNFIAKLGVTQYFDRSSYSVAVFGDVGYMITDDLRLGFGLRYSHDWKTSLRVGPNTDITVPIIGTFHLFDAVYDPRSGDWGRPSGQVGLDWTFLEDQMLYGKFSTGYKSGALVNDIPLIGGGIFPGQEVDPEDLFALEIGLKQTLLDHKLRLSTAIFSYWYENLQVSQLVESQNVVRNAAQARALGVEIEAVYRPWDELTLTASFSYLRARFLDFIGCPSAAEPFRDDIDCTGNILPRSPEFTGSFIAIYDFDLGRYGVLSPLVQAFASSELFFRATNLEIDRQPAYALLNVRLMWRSQQGNVSIEAFLDNITDEDVGTTKIVGSSLLGSPVLTSYDRPRTAGIRIGLDW